MSRPSIALTVLIVLFAAAPALAQPCTGLCTQQVTCPNNGTTSISGKVFAPNGVDPLPNVLVYVPNAPVLPFASTVTCDVAGPVASGSPLVETSTNTSGDFVLPNMPVGSNIPLVIQAGRWRRQVTISTVSACNDTVVPAALTHFPRNKTEGDIPQMAIVTGDADVTECVLRKIGIQDSEFTGPSSNGRIHLYSSMVGGGYDGAIPANSPSASETQLWSNQANANKYAMTILACPGIEWAPTPFQKNVFNNYLNAGGRVFATHLDYAWMYNTLPYATVANWNVNQPTLPNQTAGVNTSFPKGEQLAEWLDIVGASTTFGQIPLQEVRHDQDGVNSPTQSWLSIHDEFNTLQTAQFTFNTPVGAPPQNQCGRVLFAEYHVEPSPGDPTGVQFPRECSAGAMTAQEKLLEFALFDLSTFVAPDLPANVSANFVNPPEIFVQGDPAHTVTLNVHNVSNTIDTDQTLSVTVAIPNGLSLVSMAGVGAGTHWACSANTASCSRTVGLPHNATDSIALVLSVATNAPVGSGPVILTATVAGGGLASNVVVSDPITIKGRPQLTWADPASIVYGTALGDTQLNATASIPGTFTYFPPVGTLLGAGPHLLAVSFMPDDQVNYFPAPANVTIIVDKATPLITWGSPSAIVYGTALGAQLNANADVAGSFVYSPAAGSILNAGPHTLATAFTPADQANYNTANAQVALQVDKATATITWGTPSSIVYGAALSNAQLNATASTAGAFDYAPGAGTVLNAGPQALMVVFTPADTANYNGASANVTLMIDKATPAITWTTPASIVYGATLGGAQLNATANVGGSFAYSPAAGAVLNAGSQPLTTVFTPSDTANYKTANAGVTLAVSKATPTITWSNPADIPVGTALSGTQLNATASVPGAFAYTPAAGTMPPAGTNILSVNFTPTDSGNYNGASKTVMLNVSAQPAQITGMPGLDCSIWPPNNKLVQVATISAGGAAAFSVTATSNEPAVAGDIVIGGTGLQPRTVQLRATRNGGGNGRVYTITATATNLAGMVTTQTAMCSVPHDSRQ